MSLDEGIFEDFHLTIPPGSESKERLVHFAGVVDEEVGSPFSRRKFSDRQASGLMICNDPPVCRSEITYQHDGKTSLSTLVTNVHTHLLVPHIG